MGVSIAFSGNLYATHVLGGDISYTNLGTYSYKVTYRIMRSCKALPLTVIDFGVSNADGSVVRTIQATRIGIRDVTVICNQDTLPCNPQNSTVSGGQELHTFEAMVDLSQPAYDSIRNGCKVIFFTSTCCRNTSITTLVPGNFYLDAMVDLCIPGVNGNSSVKFGDNFVSEICCARPFVFNTGIQGSIDDDSLSFELSTPLRGLNDPEIYTGDFSAEIPMTPYCPPNPGVINCRALPGAKPPRGMFFDKENGDFIFTPVNCSETGVVVFTISEWRRDSSGNMQLAGYTRRESTLFVRTCADNNSPYFAGNNKYLVCEGNKICFTIATKDEPFLPKQTIPDTLNLSWDSAIAGATFRITDSAAREKSAEFCWQTAPGDARQSPYRFMGIVNDGFCSPPLQAFRSYQILVRPKAGARVEYTYGFRGKLIFESIPTDIPWYNPVNFRYQFSIRDSSGASLYTGMNQRDSFTFTQTGRYIIDHQINNPPYNCPSVYYDTISITSSHLLSGPEISKSKFSIYPSPGRGIFTIQTEEELPDQTDVSVYSGDGRQVHTTVLNGNTINLEHLARGVYTVCIMSQDRLFTFRLIIQ